MRKHWMQAATLVLACLLLGGCGLNMSLLRDLRAAREEATTEQAYVMDTAGNVVPNYDVSTAEYDASLFTKAANGRVSYAGTTHVCKAGIDVSSWQGEIDWNAVAADGIDFAIIRAGYRGWGSEGKINEDDYFKTNIEGALAAGLAVSVYFYSQAISAQEAQAEADFVLQLIKDYQISYPIVYDWEREPNEASRTANLGSSVITACARAFCDRVQAAGYPVMIYFYTELGYYNYDLEQLQDYDFWLAEYADAPTFYYAYDIWQYSKEGTVEGITGSVDLNISFQDYAATAIQ